MITFQDGKQAFAESSATYKRTDLGCRRDHRSDRNWHDLGYLASTHCLNPITRAVELAESVTQHGDLTRNIVPSSACETGQLIQTLSEMNSSLLKVVGEVRLGTGQIHDAATEIANGNLNPRNAQKSKPVR